MFITSRYLRDKVNLMGEIKELQRLGMLLVSISIKQVLFSKKSEYSKKI